MRLEVVDAGLRGGCNATMAVIRKKFDLLLDLSSEVTTSE